MYLKISQIDIQTDDGQRRATVTQEGNKNKIGKRVTVSVKGPKWQHNGQRISTQTSCFFFFRGCPALWIYSKTTHTRNNYASWLGSISDLFSQSFCCRSFNYLFIFVYLLIVSFFWFCFSLFSAFFGVYLLLVCLFVCFPRSVWSFFLNFHSLNIHRCPIIYTSKGI